MEIFAVQNTQVVQLRSAIREEYRQVADNPQRGFHFVSGRRLARVLQYGRFLLHNVPDGAIESFAGVGNPFSINTIFKGERALDIGSGAGLDSLIASKMVGPTGEVIGVDMTKEMVEKAKKNARRMGAENVKFLHGYAESIPLPDRSVDVIISNGVINLVPDKPAVFHEMYRVLKFGGRIQISDVILEKPVSAQSKNHAELWTSCVAGGILKDEYRRMLSEAGFRNIEFGGMY